jgi:hypothetical protein
MLVVSPSTLAAYPLVGAVPYRSIRYCGPFPSRLRLHRVSQTDSIKLRRLFRISFGRTAGRQRIRPTSRRTTGRSSSFGHSIPISAPCRVFRTHQTARASLPLYAIRRPRDTPIWKLEAALKCLSCRTPRHSPPVHMIKLTKEREITPYVWVHPDDNR